MIDSLIWFVTNVAMGIVNLFWVITHPHQWLNFSDPVQIVRLAYYGGSVEFFFVVFDLFIILTIVGYIWKPFMWAMVRGMEGFANIVGRISAWAALLMVIQQILIVFLQRIFLVSEITIAPFGFAFTRDLSWWSEELKLYNAILVALCCAYTFVQGSHVRVDLFYAGMRFHSKRVMDMLGSLFFILPTMVLTWLYAWFFMWRHLVTPKVSATDKLEILERKATILKWNVETIGFSPNGFDGYFLFKVLLVAFVGMMFIQGIAYFWRSMLEYREGPESEGRYLDKDSLEDETAETVAAIH